jgi:hypothetical protein
VQEPLLLQFLQQAQQLALCLLLLLLLLLLRLPHLPPCEELHCRQLLSLRLLPGRAELPLSCMTLLLLGGPLQASRQCGSQQVQGR